MIKNWSRYCKTSPVMPRRLFTSLLGAGALQACGGGGGGGGSPAPVGRTVGYYTDSMGTGDYYSDNLTQAHKLSPTSIQLLSTLLPGWTVLNYGLGGLTPREILSALRPEAPFKTFPNAEEVTLLRFGTAAATGGQNVGEFEAELELLALMAVNAGKTVILVGTDRRYLSYDAAVRAVAKRHALRYVDLTGVYPVSIDGPHVDQPTSDATTALIAAAVLRSAKGEPEPAPWETISDFSIDNDRHIGLQLMATDARGLNVADGVQELQCTMTSRGYFATGGHIAILMRYTPPPYPGLAGAGLAVGRTGDVQFLNITEPRPIVETWAPGAGLQYAAKPVARDSILPPETLGPILADATPYPILLQMGVRGGKRFVRYTMAGYDSGEWADPTTGNDVTQTGILVATSVHDNAPGMRAEFTDCRTRWSAS